MLKGNNLIIHPLSVTHLIYTNKFKYVRVQTYVTATKLYNKLYVNMNTKNKAIIIKLAIFQNKQIARQAKWKENVGEMKDVNLYRYYKN